MKTAKNDNAPRWLIVRSKPSVEVRAGEEILALGQTVYVPQFRKEFRHNRSKAWTTRYFPLMRGYLFVLASAHWGRILSCPSVSKVLRNFEMGENSSPIPIDDWIVQEIRTRQEAGEFDEMRVHGRVEQGAHLKIAEGPLAGLKGVAADIGDNNVVMMIQMFGTQVRAKAPVEKLHRAS